MSSVLTFKASVKGTASSSGEFTAVASAPTVDRDGEIIDSGALTWATDTIPIHVNHSMRVEDLVGRATPKWATDGRLFIRGRFASTPRAQEVRQLVNEGILNSVSVGFMNGKRSQDSNGQVRITSGELLEVSFVSVPSNREAVLVSSRSWTPRRLGGCSAAEIRAFAELAEAEVILNDLRIEDAKAVHDAELALWRINRRFRR